MDDPVTDSVNFARAFQNAPLARQVLEDIRYRLFVIDGLNGRGDFFLAHPEIYEGAFLSDSFYKTAGERTEAFGIYQLKLEGRAAAVDNKNNQGILNLKKIREFKVDRHCSS
jgi:hypothetical protein